MCDIAATRFFLAFIYVAGRYKIQEMCDRVISEDPFMLLYCPHRCKTQGICDQDVDNCLATFKFFSDWFVTIKMLKKLDSDLHVNDDMLLCNEDFHKFTFIVNQKHLVSVYLDKINLGNDNNFDEDDPDTIIHSRLLTWRIKSEKRKALKKR